MEIKSSLINDSTFSEVKKSLIMASLVDGKEKFRVRMLEYINDTADNSNDMFFYDMLEFVRFLNPAEDAIAYTTEEKLIYLNSPGKPGESVRSWDFIYCHECLHQLWDTFGVANKLKSEGIEYNHNVLNIASDCVINDYLSYNRKKEMFENGISPQYLKDKFGVEYDRKNDTQYSLYLKLLDKKKEIENDPVCQQSFDGKIKPKSVSKNGGDDGDDGMSEKHSKDYIKGWTDAIQDTLDKKVDPLDKNRKQSDTGNDEYDKGYEDCIEQIKNGLEQGVELSDSKPGKSGGDLPQIPWDIDNDKSSNGSDSSDSSNDSDSSNKSDSSDSSGDSNSSNKSDSSDSSNDSDSSDGSDNSDSSNDSGRSKSDKSNESAKEAASRAAKAAKEARDAADKAKQIADNASKNNDKDADKKREAANDAAAAAKEAEAAAKEADKYAKRAEASKSQNVSNKNKEAAKEAADKAEVAAEAAKNKIQQSNGDNNKPSKGAGNGEHVAKSETDVDIAEITKRANDVIEKYRNKISGAFGEFINKCKASKELKKSGLAINVQKGATGWNNKMNEIVNQYVKTKVFKAKQQYESTYRRVKRGSGFVKFGNPIEPGVQRKQNLMTINVGFYIDSSGSMGSSIDNVFDACYTIAEALQKQFSKEKVVDDISFKVFAFDTGFQEIKYGKRVRSAGGTMPFHSLLEGIKKRTDDHLINIIITDAQFDSINESEVNKFIDDISGLIVFITNNSSDHRVETISKKHKNKLEYILADPSFKIDK
jgi:hypothetical protein